MLLLYRQYRYPRYAAIVGFTPKRKEHIFIPDEENDAVQKWVARQHCFTRQKQNVLKIERYTIGLHYNKYSY